MPPGLMPRETLRIYRAVLYARRQPYVMHHTVSLSMRRLRRMKRIDTGVFQPFRNRRHSQHNDALVDQWVQSRALMQPRFPASPSSRETDFSLARSGADDLIEKGVPPA